MSDIEEHIRKAIEEGKFSDLPGKGKPLDLEDNAHEDPEWRLAYHVLRQGGFTLPWIELQHEIDTEIEVLRASLGRAWNWRQEAIKRGEPGLLVDGEWARAWRGFGEQVQRLNKRIFEFNLQAPTVSIQRMQIDLERELDMVKRADSQYPS